MELAVGVPRPEPPRRVLPRRRFQRSEHRRHVSARGPERSRPRGRGRAGWSPGGRRAPRPDPQGSRRPARQTPRRVVPDRRLRRVPGDGRRVGRRERRFRGRSHGRRRLRIRSRRRGSRPRHRGHGVGRRSLQPHPAHARRHHQRDRRHQPRRLHGAAGTPDVFGGDGGGNFPGHETRDHPRRRRDRVPAQTGDAGPRGSPRMVATGYPRHRRDARGGEAADRRTRRRRLRPVRGRVPGPDRASDPTTSPPTTSNSRTSTRTSTTTATTTRGARRRTRFLSRAAGPRTTTRTKTSRRDATVRDSARRGRRRTRRRTKTRTTTRGGDADANARGAATSSW